MYTIKIDDSQFRKFLEESPVRASWAMKESLRAAGYSLKKKMMKMVDSLLPLAESTVHRKTKYNVRSHRLRTKPLELFARLIRVSYTGRGGKQAYVRIGFMNTNNWFKRFFGVGAADIAELHEGGSYRPVKRNKSADKWARKQGMAVKSNRGGQHGVRPGRPIIGPVWQKENTKIRKYIEKKFFEVFFSKKKPGLKY